MTKYNDIKYNIDISLINEIYQNYGPRQLTTGAFNQAWRQPEVAEVFDELVAELHDLLGQVLDNQHTMINHMDEVHEVIGKLINMLTSDTNDELQFIIVLIPLFTQTERK